MTMTVSFLEEQDIGDLCNLAKISVEELFPYLQFSKEKVYSLLNNCGKDTSYINCLVAKLNKKIIGYLLFVISPHLYAEGNWASILALYVYPEKRGTSAALYLMKTFTEIALELNSVEIQAATHTGYHVEQSQRFFERCGYKFCGTSHVHKGVFNGISKESKY